MRKCKWLLLLLLPRDCDSFRCWCGPCAWDHHITAQPDCSVLEKLEPRQDRHSDRQTDIYDQRHYYSTFCQWVAFKVAGLVHQSLAGVAPAYLVDDCHLLSDAGRRPLRSQSNDIRKLLVPSTHNKLGDRSFSTAGPRLWNDLLPGLRRPGLSFDSFRRSLKTHLGNWSA